MRYRDRAFYPSDWPQRAAALKASVGCCQRCGARPGEKKPNRFGELKPVVLTVAHLDHDPYNPAARLCVLCAACHLRYDASHAERFRKAHNMAVARGQLEMFGEDV